MHLLCRKNKGGGWWQARQWLRRPTAQGVHLGDGGGASSSGAKSRTCHVLDALRQFGEEQGRTWPSVAAARCAELCELKIQRNSHNSVPMLLLLRLLVLRPKLCCFALKCAAFAQGAQQKNSAQNSRV
jgi:hypothetical protein